MSDAPKLERLVVRRKIGAERFRDGATDLGFDLISFWQWYVSDLVSNATRGCLAEYIVARALDANPCGVRDEWAACDLTTPDGTKVEVKSAAYVQSWHQRDYSPIQFLTRKTRGWDANTNVVGKEARRQAEVYVFAVLHHKDKDSIDPMDVAQWSFYVLPTRTLDERTRSQHSITLASLKRLSEEVHTFGGLAEAVRRAGGRAAPSSTSAR